MNTAELRKYRYSGALFSVKTNSKGVLQKKFVLIFKKWYANKTIKIINNRIAIFITNHILTSRPFLQNVRLIFPN